MSLADWNQDMTAADYKATYVDLCIVGAVVTGVLFIFAFIASLFDGIIDVVLLVMLPGILVSSNAIALDPEAVKRIGKKWLFVFYLIAGQVLCIFPVTFISNIFNYQDLRDGFLLGSVMGVIVAFVSLLGIKLKERYGDVRFSFRRN